MYSSKPRVFGTYVPREVPDVMTGVPWRLKKHARPPPLEEPPSAPVLNRISWGRIQALSRTADAVAERQQAQQRQEQAAQARAEERHRQWQNSLRTEEYERKARVLDAEEREFRRRSDAEFDHTLEGQPDLDENEIQSPLTRQLLNQARYVEALTTVGARSTRPTTHEVQQQFRARSRQVHPDRHEEKERATATTRFQQLKNAYDLVLQNMEEDEEAVQTSLGAILDRIEEEEEED